MPEVGQQGQQVGPGGHRGAADGQRQPRVGDHAAAQHQRVAAAGLQAALRIGHRPHLAVGDHRHGHRGADLGNAFPVGRCAVAVQLGARVDDQLAGTGVGDGAGAVEHARLVGIAQPHLGRDLDPGRHGAPHRAHDGVHQPGLVQPHGAAAVPVHRRRRAAEVQVDAWRPQFRQPRRVVGQAGRVAAQQLRPHGHPGGSAAAVQQFRHDAGEDARGQQLVGDADEFRDAAVDAADTGERVAQAVVEQALHGGEKDAHGPWMMPHRGGGTGRLAGRISVDWLSRSAGTVRFAKGENRPHHWAEYRNP